MKVKINDGIPDDDLPRLICVSGRTEEGITSILDYVKNIPLDAEYTYIIQQAFRYIERKIDFVRNNSAFFRKQVENNIYRGFGIFTKLGEMKRSIKLINAETSKLCLVFSNFGKEVLRLGYRLKEFPIFANTIDW